VCDQAAPAPIPPIGSGLAGLAASLRQVIGLYHDEIVKHASEASCRGQVRAENQSAFSRAR
jgi:hypothetical protein